VILNALKLTDSFIPKLKFSLNLKSKEIYLAQKQDRIKNLDLYCNNDLEYEFKDIGIL